MVRKYIVTFNDQLIKTFNDRASARRYADKLDNLHGCYIAQVVVIYKQEGER